jgi:hypothetical protein
MCEFSCSLLHARGHVGSLRAYHTMQSGPVEYNIPLIHARQTVPER